MLDPHGQVAWNSYTMQLVSLAESLLRQVSEEAIAVKHPTYQRLEPLASEQRAIIAVPTMEPGPATVQVKYFAKARTIHIDLSRFFTVEPLHIPRGNRASIPVSRMDRPEGPCLVFHFGRTEFKEIGPSRRRGSTLKAPAAQIAAAAGPQQ